MPAWSWLLPTIAFALLVVAAATGVGSALSIVCSAAIVAAVIAAVHHAEVVAHRVGEPFGTLVLAISVTAIEASIVLSMMFAGGADVAVVPRDTIYAAIMIISTGVVGACVLVGGIAHREQSFRVEGSSAGLATLIALAVLVLVLPDFTLSTPPGEYAKSQLEFVAVASTILWALFVFVQTVRHRDYFLPAAGGAAEEHAEPPTTRAALLSFALLILCLVTVVGLAKVLSPIIERKVIDAGAPKAVIGIVIALVVLLPETWAAVRAARANRLQTSMNLAIGSALATIGLTIPVVAVTAIAFRLPLVLGLEPRDLAMLAATFLISTVTLGFGRTNMMLGAVHLVMFAAFLFLAFVP